MNRIQAAEFIHSQIQARWAEWKPTSIEIKDWIGWLEKYDFDIACRAASELSRTSRIFKRPLNGDFFKLCQDMQKASGRENPGRKKPVLKKGYLICVEESPQRPFLKTGMDYFFRQTSPDEDIQELAERTRRNVEHATGARFKIYIPEDMPQKPLA